jgi:hypothetical protein
MKTLKFLPSFLAVAALSLPGAALAVDAEVTFKNLHASQEAVYQVVSSGEAFTYANANPTPDNSVLPGATDVYTVGNPASNLVTPVIVRYKIGSKQCIFNSSYTGTPPSLLGSSITPNWTKSVTPSGGATCTATITSVNPSTFNWKVTFTMK